MLDKLIVKAGILVRKTSELPDMNELTLEQCYALLELSPGASIVEIDAAYSKKALEKVQQGAKQEKALLKVAYEQIKQHLYETAQSESNSLTDQIVEFIERLNPEPFHVKIQTDTLQIFLKTNLKQDYGDQIYQQIRTLELPEIKTIVIYGMRSSKLVGWKKHFTIEAVSPEDCDPYSFKNRYVLLLAFPVTICFAILFQSLGFTKVLLFPLQLWVHEVGHATVAWFSGRRALPLPFGWTNVLLERSLFVYFGMLLLFGLLFWAGWKEKKRSAMLFAVICAIVQFVMTWIQTADQFEMWLAFGGVGGEFYLSALMIAGFYFQLPNYWRWDFWRYPLIISGANTFWGAFSMWQDIQKGTRSIPWGSLLLGEDVGDMNTLSEAYNWSDKTIITTYSTLGNVCLMALISLYIFFLIKHRRWIVDRITSKPL